MLEKLNIDKSLTPERFHHFTEEAIHFLIDKLQALDKLEQEIFERSRKLKNPEKPNQLQPGEKELWKEYEERYKAIVDPISVKPNKNGGRSFGEPTKYKYLNYHNSKIVFIMKSDKRAVIETYYEYGIEKKDQFVLRRENDIWKIETKKYGFPDEDTWYQDNL